MESLRVLVVQECPVSRDIAGNVARVRELLARHPSVDIAVFPELFVTGYQLKGLAELALGVESPEIRSLRDSCAEFGTALVIGYLEAGPYNSLLCIDRDGSVAGSYRKTHLFGVEGEAFERGERLECVELAGVLVGPMICFDVEIAEVARTLTRKGAQLLVGVAANMDPYFGDHLLACRARALDNRRPLVYANRIGSESGFDFVGGSRFVETDGSVVTELGGESAAVVIEVPFGAQIPAEIDYVRHLRTELY